VIGIAHRVNAERLVLLGWSRAIVLQMAHPLIAAGVADHSQFRASPMTTVTRLHGTVRAMLALTFGDPIEHGHAIAGIRAIHKRVRGQLREPTGVFAAGTPYSAEDPALLLWVHATLIESVILAYERLIGPLSVAERDEYCRDAADVALALGADDGDLPHTFAEMESYLQREYVSGRIAVGADAREIVDAVLFPPLRAISGPAAWLNRLITLGWLPAFVRDQYGYAWNERRDRQLGRAEAFIRAVRRLTPRPLALWREARR
jgi:uncharacterized protein (DUF2236 family)